MWVYRIFQNPVFVGTKNSHFFLLDLLLILLEANTSKISTSVKKCNFNRNDRQLFIILIRYNDTLL